MFNALALSLPVAAKLFSQSEATRKWVLLRFENTGFFTNRWQVAWKAIDMRNFENKTKLISTQYLIPVILNSICFPKYKEIQTLILAEFRFPPSMTRLRMLWKTRCLNLSRVCKQQQGTAEQNLNHMLQNQKW